MNGKLTQYGGLALCVFMLMVGTTACGTHSSTHTSGSGMSQKMSNNTSNSMSHGMSNNTTNGMSQ